MEECFMIFKALLPWLFVDRHLKRGPELGEMDRVVSRRVKAWKTWIQDGRNRDKVVWWIQMLQWNSRPVDGDMLVRHTWFPEAFFLLIWLLLCWALWTKNSERQVGWLTAALVHICVDNMIGSTGKEIGTRTWRSRWSPRDWCSCRPARCQSAASPSSNNTTKRSVQHIRHFPNLKKI